ncbi:MAG TPA: 50S ribosomal protein L4 [Candidatus Mcinerneyibacteriales bacterium]|nr:50S ribosomal protein L4 [Candidatus Mcinerneyibacteriales bacterium]
MMELKVFNMEGQEIGKEKVSEYVFGIEPNMALIHQAVVRQLANKRVGTHATKTRSEVRGGGRKPWKQKGTGRARQGTIRAPQWVGGGIVFGPKPRDYSKKMPQKMRQLALRSALSLKAKDEGLVLVDAITLKEFKTRLMADFIGKFKEEKQKVMVVIGQFDENIHRSTRNIPKVNMVSANRVNVYDLMWADKVIMVKEAAHAIEEVLG